VAVHDAARARLITGPAKSSASSRRRGKTWRGSFWAAPITDTPLSFADANQVVSGSIDRQNVFRDAGRPQIFRRSVAA